MSSYGGPSFSYQLPAGADLNTDAGTGTQFKAIAVGGTIAAASATTIGLLQNKPKNGEDAQVLYLGPGKGVAGAAITAGARVMVTTSGYLIACTSGHVPVGKAIATAVSGGVFEGLFNFINGGTISF